MKREKEIYPKVTKYKSLIFWKECRFCHKEFKREQSFKIVDYKASRGCGEDPFYTTYCCSNCANSIDEVEEKIHKVKENFLKNRPRNPYSNKKEKMKLKPPNVKEVYDEGELFIKFKEWLKQKTYNKN